MDWKTLIIGGLIGALVAIPFSVFGNIATPWVKSYFEKSSLSVRERRIYILLERYKRIKSARINPALMSLSYINRLISAFATIFPFVLLVLTSVVGIYFTRFVETSGDIMFYFVVLSFILAGFASWSLLSSSKEIDDVLDFDKYKQKTIKKLIKLGSNPEDLDKQEDENNPSEGEK